MEQPVAGPSRLPYSPGQVEERLASGSKASKRRSCTSCRRAAALAMTMSLFSGAAAADSELLGFEKRRVAPLADHFVEQEDGVWVQTTDWQLMGKSAAQKVSPQQPVADLQAPDASAAAASTTSAGTPAPSAPGVTVPSAWTPDPRTSFYAVPVIVVMSVLVAVSIVILMFAIVLVRRRRSRRAKLKIEDDPEEIDEKSSKPKTRRARISAAVRQRTAGMRRRGKKRKMALTRQVEGAADHVEHPAVQDLSEAVVQGPALTRQMSQGDRSIVSVSTRNGGREEDDDATSVTALTSPNDSRSVRRMAPGPAATTAFFFRQSASNRRSVVSLSDADLPHAPPAYGSSSSRMQPLESVSRRDQKRRMMDEQIEAEEAPPVLDSEPPPVNMSDYVGHVSTDDKAALARLAGMASAPEGTTTQHVEHSAPDAEAIEQAMLDEALDEPLDGDPEVVESALASSLLPAPPKPLIRGARYASRPSAPPVSVASAPSAPPLPDYEPSAPQYEGDSVEGQIEHREDHIEV